jgi:hypothetical protein
MTDAHPGIWGRKMQVVGWLCVVGVALVIFDLVSLLPHLPEAWWHPEQPPRLDQRGGMTFDLRTMSVDFGLAWLGDWGYLAALIWIPTAVARAVRARPLGLTSTPAERILFVTLCVLMTAASLLVHLTPLRYPSYNILVL